MTQSKREQRRREYREWFIANPTIWEGWNPEVPETSKRIIRAMKRAGLLSETTYWKDVNIASIVAEVRAK